MSISLSKSTVYFFNREDTRRYAKTPKENNIKNLYKKFLEVQKPRSSEIGKG